MWDYFCDGAKLKDYVEATNDLSFRMKVQKIKINWNSEIVIKYKYTQVFYSAFEFFVWVVILVIWSQGKMLSLVWWRLLIWCWKVATVTRTRIEQTADESWENIMPGTIRIGPIEAIAITTVTNDDYYSDYYVDKGRIFHTPNTLARDRSANRHSSWDDIKHQKRSQYVSTGEKDILCNVC